MTKEEKQDKVEQTSKVEEKKEVKKETAKVPTPLGVHPANKSASGQKGASTSSRPQKSELGGKTKKKKEVEAVMNIYTSFNNTIVHVTDMSGRTIAKVTGGMVTKHSRLKANPTIAMFIAKRIAEQVKDLGVKSFYVRIRAKTGNPAPGPGANAIMKSLTRSGFKISNILDTTRVARGGPKKKGGRRGRRP